MPALIPLIFWLILHSKNFFFIVYLLYAMYCMGSEQNKPDNPFAADNRNVSPVDKVPRSQHEALDAPSLYKGKSQGTPTKPSVSPYSAQYWLQFIYLMGCWPQPCWRGPSNLPQHPHYRMPVARKKSQEMGFRYLPCPIAFWERNENCYWRFCLH